MRIAWTYVDKKAAAINALRDYGSMEYIVQNYPNDTREVRAHLTNVHMPLMTGLRQKPNPRAMESKVAATLDLIDVVEERYQQALEYMSWFQPAWSKLSDEERLILSSCGQWEDTSQAVIIQRIGDMLGFEKTAVYSRKDRAARHLAVLLYGK